MATNPTEQILQDTAKWEDSLAVENKTVSATVELDEEQFACNAEESIKYIPTPNFTDVGSAGSQLPINMANEAITILSRYRAEFDFVDFVKEKLNYNSRIAVSMAFFSEQIDALVLAIKQFEVNKAFILGDMAGLGKGRVVAGVMRYAYQQKIVPVFMTEKENLFSDIFRDIDAIGGFGGSGDATIKPRPFIMKPLDKTRLKNEDGTDVKDEKGRLVYVNNNDLIDDSGNVLWTPLRQGELDELLKSSKSKSYDVDFTMLKKKARKYGYDFNCVFLTYSVISQTRGESGENKKAFIRNIAKDSIISFDECHNASGSSKLGEEAKMLVMDARGILFSSATYAKNPQSFPLYIIKTSMGEARVDITNIEKAIGVGGENVSEYIASVLVKEGQMIRRERDFRGCGMGTVYEGSDKIGVEAQQSRDRIYQLFNDAVIQFKNVYDFIKRDEFHSAIDNAVERKIAELGIKLADQTEYELGKTGKVKDREENQKAFIIANRGKYVIVKKDTNTLGANTKFHFSETLFLSIKSKFTAEAVIRELHTQTEHKYFDGKVKKSNTKPIIALRATGETIFDKLNLKKGDRVVNDFSQYIKAIVAVVRRGEVIFRKVNNDLYKANYQMVDDDGIAKEFIQEEVEYEIMDGDFADGGQELNELVQSANNYISGIPLSPIDYIIDIIQSATRASWDRFGLRTPNFKVGEITARNSSLIKDGDSGDWIYSTNERQKSVKRAFNSFNNGNTDVLIINSSGSTGGSIHSSEYFADQRPRTMFIMQVELNVSTEVQKRGQINRSGQVNFPSYLYVLSQVPSEIRKFMSLRNKMRRLDANVSANQSQNSNIVDIKDKEGKSFEDIFNKYGEEAFAEFISDDGINPIFREIYDEMNSNVLAEVFKEEVVVESGETIMANLYQFTRELELYPCLLQEEFYNRMNILYRQVIDGHCVEGTYQLELSTDNLKASLQSRLVKQLNSGVSEFSKPLFVEDKYCLSRRAKWSKEKVEEEIVKMAKAFYNDREDEFTNLRTFHNQMLEEFEIEQAQLMEERIADLDEKEPRLEDYVREYVPDRKLSDKKIAEQKEKQDEGKAKFDEALAEYQELRTQKISSWNLEKATIEDLLRFYTPNRNVEFMRFYTPEGTSEPMTTYNYGKLIGYSLKPTGKHKYTKGSIYFKFAFLTGTLPSLEVNINRGIDELRGTKQNTIEKFSATRKRADGMTEGEALGKEVNDWNVLAPRRDIVRFLSGNILSGIEIANNMRKSRDVKRWVLVKYTNADGTVSTGIRLDSYEDNPFVTIKNLQEYGGEYMKEMTISVALDNEDIINYLKLTPLAFEFPVLVDTMNKANKKVRNLIKMFKSKSDMNTVGVEIFHGFPDKVKGADEALLTERINPNDSDGNNPIYFADFLRVFERNKVDQKEYVIRKRKKYGVTDAYFVYSPDFKKKTMINGFEEVGVKAKAGFSKIYKFDRIDTEEGSIRLGLFLRKMFEEQMMTLDFSQNISEYYTKIGERDIYVTTEEKGKQEQKLSEFPEGDYEYRLDVEFTPEYRKSLPPDFKEYVKGKNSFDKGSVILYQPIKPTFARAYNIYPINLSDETTVQLLLSVFDSDEREVFIKEITERVEKGDNVNAIGDFVSTESRKKSVPEIKYIFGKRRTSEIGELLKQKAQKAELSKLAYDIAEDDSDVVKPSRKKTQITREDAEKFVNYLMF